MKARIALVSAVVACLVFTLLGPVAAQTTTTTSSTTTTTVDPAAVAGRAASSLPLPSPQIRMNPDASRDQVVNLPTWLWVEPQGPVGTSRSEGPTTVEVTASIVSVRFDTGDGETLTCPRGGTPYDLGRPEDAQHSACTHTWRHSSAAGGTYHVTATVTWGLGWSGGALGTRQATGSTDVLVAEAQALDRPPTPLPGQTIVGGEPGSSSESLPANSRGGNPAGNGSNKPPKKPKDEPWWKKAIHATGGFLGDVGTGTWGVVKGVGDAGVLLYRLNPFHAVWNPDDYAAARKELGDGVVHLVTHPGDLIGWDDIRNGHPGRAVPDILLLVVPAAKAVSAARGVRAVEEAAKAAEAARAAKLANEAAEAAKASSLGDAAALDGARGAGALGPEVAAAADAARANQASAFEDLAKYRAGQGMPVAGSAQDGATAARLDVGGQSFYGQNAHGNEIDMRVNAQTRTHAEADAFQQAKNAGAASKTATLYVDRGLCAACGANGGIGSMMRATGIDNLIVVTPDGSYLITAARPSVPIPLG